MREKLRMCGMLALSVMLAAAVPVTAGSLDEVRSAGSDNYGINVDCVVETNNDWTQYAVVTARDAGGSVLWTYETERYEMAELSRVQGLGRNGDTYYLLEDGTVSALSVADGRVLWSNSDFGGAQACCDFGPDGTLYLDGFYGPCYYSLSPAGETICRIAEFDADHYWPTVITYHDGHVVVALSGSTDEYEVASWYRVEADGSWTQITAGNDEDADIYASLYTAYLAGRVYGSGQMGEYGSTTLAVFNIDGMERYDNWDGEETYLGTLNATTVDVVNPEEGYDMEFLLHFEDNSMYAMLISGITCDVLYSYGTSFPDGYSGSSSLYAQE